MVLTGCMGDATENACRLEGQVKGGAPFPPTLQPPRILYKLRCLACCRKALWVLVRRPGL